MSEVPPFIAVIDDDESMCRGLGRLLNAADHETRIYFSAEAFLEDPDHSSARFVVTDIQLRGMSGFDLLDRIHQESPATPVALITAHDETNTRDRAASSGCVAYLRKPFPASELLAAILHG